MGQFATKKLKNKKNKKLKIVTILTISMGLITKGFLKTRVLLQLDVIPKTLQKTTDGKYYWEHRTRVHGLKKQKGQHQFKAK